ncbi:ROK family transcriptional regulator [Rathayibacter soli]|uniref:ROK family transcriptional regulator n=1 Tax=Rathayibacter soli TaxID=3144168 RepID=UPI0027E43623|nr:ROK family transcriptional regulator [Glaciibacter superstes]
MAGTKAARSTGAATTRSLAQVNRTAIIELLRNSGALSKREICRRTGLSSATVNRLTAALLDERIIAVAGSEPSSGGRPSLLLRYAGRARSVASVQVHAERASGVLVDLEGRIVFRRDVALEDSTGPDVPAEHKLEVQERQLASIGDLLRYLIAAADRMSAPCVALCVAVPGTVLPPNGLVASMPEIGWDEIPLGRILGAEFDLPLVVANDADALAFGELRRGSGRGSTSLVALLLNRGLGAGIITNGELYLGATANAGEVGYLLMDRSAFGRSYGEHGDLEDRIGSAAITRQARERGIPVPDGTLTTAEEILALASNGDRAAQELATEIVDMISMAVAALVIILDPELVVIASTFGNAEALVPEIQRRLTGRIIRVPRIEVAAFREDAVLIGAAELAAAEVNNFAYLSY